MENTQADERFMRLALQKARLALRRGDVPIGAVVVCDGAVVASAYNRREADLDPTAHAEIIALKRAGKRLKRWNLSDCELYVTVEPCAMCAGALVNARVKRLVFGAPDTRFGCCGSLMDLCRGTGLNHEPEVRAGVLKNECSELVSDFFKRLRREKKAVKF